jgi:hypothetical protein
MTTAAFNSSDLSQSSTNWIVAQRSVGAFAPHAQAAPNLTLMVDAGHLLNGSTLTETNPQTVGPFTLPTALRVDRVVIDRTTGVAAIVSGSEGVMTPPALPAGTLPVARVYLRNNTAAVTNDIIVDERAVADLSPPTSSAMICHADLNGVDQTGLTSGVWSKINFSNTTYNVGNGFQTANKRFLPTSAGYYLATTQIAMNTTANTQFGVGIYKNGTSYAYNTFGSSTTVNNTLAVTAIVYLNGSTDYLETWGAHNNGSAGTVYGIVQGSFFQATRIG